MAKTPTFNCELVKGDRTMYGLVSAVVRESDSKVRVTVHGGQFDKGGVTDIWLDADGVTNVRTGEDARAVGL